MISAEHEKQGRFMLYLDTPDWIALKAIAKEYSISYDAALVAIVYKGMDTIKAQHEEARTHDKGKDEEQRQHKGGGL